MEMNYRDPPRLICQQFIDIAYIQSEAWNSASWKERSGAELRVILRHLECRLATSFPTSPNPMHSGATQHIETALDGIKRRVPAAPLDTE